MEKLNTQNAVIIDTETTGLDDKSEIVEITVISAASGDVLFHSLVRPSSWIPNEATAIHGITNSKVSNAPRFVQVIEPLFHAIQDSEIITYNADFDSRLFIQSYERSDQLTTCEIRQCYFALKFAMLKATCAMNWYAEFFGEWDESHGGYKWQSLSNACAQQGVITSDLIPHSSADDCEMTRRLIDVVNLHIQSELDNELAFEAHQDAQTDAFLTRRSGR
ncbi:3'-5' exonuclease [Vibrio cyclitrophicus]|uniref:3'-5' exonuclease n=1 Tax=Vibrio cyclitrophicus TaxID=47951 RepID=UPI00148E63F1|nr:3'-5' exonuclease [Vibrio cyclitrophicus]NOI34045.1 3'-5' exonuclease [Vibrio cyclitrophicus]